MIKETNNPEVGVIAYSVVNDEFHVSTVNLPRRSLLNPMAELRNDWWPPKYPNETMVFAVKDGQRVAEPLHCQGHRKIKSALRTHKRLCKRLQKQGKSVLNGQQMQTQKEVGPPVGLIKNIEAICGGLG